MGVKKLERVGERERDAKEREREKRKVREKRLKPPPSFYQIGMSDTRRERNEKLARLKSFPFIFEREKNEEFLERKRMLVLFPVITEER